MSKKLFVLLTMFISVTLIGCSGAPVQQDSSSDNSNMSSSGSSEGGSGQSATISGASGSSNLGVFADSGSSVSELLSTLLIYFDFDQSDIDSEFNSTIAAHGDRLANNNSLSIRLEGHADERGSREYNIGLGERRAQAVRRLLLLQGATSEQITIVSYGEERPVVVGSNEESYSLNRRVELVY